MKGGDGEILSTPSISAVAKQASLHTNIYRNRILCPYHLHFLLLASSETNQPTFVEHQKRSFRLHEGKSKLANTSSNLAHCTKIFNSFYRIITDLQSITFQKQHATLQ